ncbi:hypothetical protein D9611_015169 [Ephemerocybe angulata]|uniref:F-box domain-containing protein n=1 Tax=Ephemerocybe angulata TaxID=980116 RepID=A0A8H5B7U8_9AGAR|nr:hypothetical protein D9611_015169 [Tulosesus angulatus]
MSKAKALDRFLSNNDLPGPQELHELKVTLASVSRHIDDVYKDLAGLERIRSLIRTICSPIRRMPTELLGRIFSMALEMPLDRRGRCDLISFSLVCRAWRLASLGARSLWSGVVISSCECFEHGFDEVDHMHDEEEYEKMVEWFARAGGTPKTLEYRLSGTSCHCSKGMRCTISHPMVERLIREGPPLARFSLQASSIGCLKSWSIFTELASTKVQAAWVSLHSFSLSFIDSEDHLWDDDDGNTPSVFSLLPNFSSFDLRLPKRDMAFDEREDSLNAMIGIPDDVLGRIRMLSIALDWEGCQLFHILPRSTSLTNLTINLAGSKLFTGPRGPLDPFPRSPITLPNLRKFILLKGDFGIFDILRTPSLEILDVEVVGASVGSQAELERLRRFIEVSALSKVLRDLSIRGMVGDAGVVDLSLPVLSSLEVLELDSPYVSSYYLGDPVEVSTQGHPRRRHPSLIQLRLMNIRRSEDTLVSELRFLENRKMGYTPCIIAIRFYEEPRFSEAELKVRAAKAIPNFAFVNVYPFSEL